MAEFMMIICDDERPGVSEAEIVENYARIGPWWEEPAKAGRLTGGHKLQPAATARTVRIKGGDATLTDGPFIESKEIVGGYGIIEAPDIDAAVAIASSWAGTLPITIEVRPVQVMNER